jgi:hypothetical protein
MSNSNAYNTGKIFDGYMGRNVIINGNCNVAQRAAAAFTTGGPGYGGPDRFWANNSSGGGQFTQSQGAITFNGVAKNAVVQTVNTAITSSATTNYWSGIVQYIEGINCYHFLGQPISVSFIFNTNVSGTYSVAVRDSTAANSYVTTFTAVANTPARYTFNIPTLSTSLVIPNNNASGMSIWIGSLNTGTYQTSGINLWQSGSFISASGATNWGASTSNFIAVTELQIEEGAIATPFEREAYSVTVNKCWRYYYSTSVPASTPQIIICVGIINSATNIVFSFNMPVSMRVAPTLTSNNLYTTSATAQNAGTSTTVVASNNNQIEFSIGAAGATYTVGQAGGLYIGNGTVAGGFFLSAEF